MNVWNIAESSSTDSIETYNISELIFYDNRKKEGFPIRESIKKNLIKDFELKGFSSDKEFNSKIAGFIDFMNDSNQFTQILARNIKNKLDFIVTSKSRHYQTFSQNFSASGKIGISYEIGLRNFMSCLETISLKAEKHTEEGNSFDMEIKFPFIRKNQSASITAIYHRNMLFADFLVERLAFGAKLLNKKDNSQFEFNFERNRPTFNSLVFQGINYENMLEKEYNINFAHQQQLSNTNSILHDNRTLRTARLVLYSPLRADLQYTIKNCSKMYLHHLINVKSFRRNLMLRKLELENNFEFFVNNSINHQKSISALKRGFFSRSRGFHNLNTNLPFFMSQGHVNNQISFINTTKLNLKRFPLFEKQDNVYPFFHLSTYTNSFNWFKRVSFDCSAGVGLTYKVSDSMGIEFLYNFLHHNSTKSLFNKREDFQVRISFDD